MGKKGGDLSVRSVAHSTIPPEGTPPRPSPVRFRYKKGELVFDPGEMRQEATVAVMDDSVKEADESFTLVLSHAVFLPASDYRVLTARSAVG